MSLTEALARKFPPTVRYKGEAYATRGNVRILRGNELGVEALVQGTDQYQVRIRRDPNGARTRFTFNCSCPYFEKYSDPCKHLWATLRVADTAGYLRALGAKVTRRTAEVAPDTRDVGDGLPPAGLAVLDDPGHGTAVLDIDDAEEDGPVQPEGDLLPPFVVALDARLATRDANPTPAYRFAGAEMLFVLDVPGSIKGQGLALHLLVRKRAQTGEWTKPQPARLSPDDVAQAPAWDRRIFAPLFGAATALTPAALVWPTPDRDGGQARFALPDPLVRELLPTIARSGRAYVRPTSSAADLHPVRWDEGAAWRFRLTVTPTEDVFRIDGHFERGDQRLALTSPLLVLPEGFLITRSTIARWDADTETALLTTLRETGPVDVALGARSALAQVLARAGVPADDLPEGLHVTSLRVSPIPRVRLGTLPGWPGGDRLLATVSFDYGGTIVAHGATGGDEVFDPVHLRIVHRHPDEETAHLRTLTDLGFTTEWDPAGLRMRLELRVKRLAESVRRLVADGWVVEGEAGAYRSAGPLLFSVTSGIDWFDLDARADFGGMTVPLTEILDALRRGEGVVRLGDGGIGLLPEEWLRRYLPLTIAAEAHGDTLRFKPAQAALLDALLPDDPAEAVVTLDEPFAQLRRELGTFSEIAAEDPPATFIGTLRPYQREGLGWFTFLRRFGFGGCLADDMGLGKTVMVLALLDSRRAERRPSLVVVPRSLVGNWMSEAVRFAPELRVLDYSRTTRGAFRSSIADYDAVLCTYGTLRRDVEMLGDVEFDYLILDEAQAIKNSTTASARAVRQLKGRHRLALSGTPIENHLGELWSLFEFLNPGVLGSSSVFERATSSSSLVPAPELTNTLARGLRPFILRRTKAQVARDLPARTEQTLFCELSAKERALYDSLKRHYRTTLLGRTARLDTGASKLQVLEALLRLRQVACHSGLVDANQRDASSAKFDLLLPRLREVIEEGHKALVFSQFTTLLGLLRQSLDAEKVRYEYLDGRTRDRGAPVERFQQDPEVGLFLISLKAGGLGLNLTAAEYVFLLDPWWNPAVEAQAIDRAHRIGQRREVFAYRLIAKDTVEEKVLQLQDSKRALADAVLSADAVGLRHLTRDDLELLLS